MDGETAGILSSCESQLPRVRGATGKPVKVGQILFCKIKGYGRYLS